MANSYSAEVWLDSRRWDALEAVLEEQGTSIEKYLQDYLVDLYRELVPTDQVREIEDRIQQERQEELREAEARKVFSVFRLWENGKDRCLATESPKEFLETARLLRRHLQEKTGGADDFARKIYGGYDIPLSRFDELMRERLENTGRVAGVFELDFDKQVLSAVSIPNGWKSYWFRDVSAAAYHAFRKGNCPEDEQWRRLLDRLEGRELTDLDTGGPLKALRSIGPGDLTVIGNAGHIGRLLVFQATCEDAQTRMSLFGPRAQCIQNEGRLDIFISYDVARQKVYDRLDLIICRGAGTAPEPSVYELSPQEQELVKNELEAHCMRLYGQSLNGRCADLYQSEAKLPPVLDGVACRLDLKQICFEDEISEFDGKLYFYIPVTFDPDAVFGTNVTSDSNGDWLNVYANYDLETGRPEQSLTVVLVCGDGNEFEFSYPLAAPEREQLRENMDDYCQAQTGMSLEEYRQELLTEESQIEQGPQM